MDTYLGKLEKAALLGSIRNLLTFPYVKALTDRNELTLHAAYFGVADGKLLVHEADGRFVSVAVEEHNRLFAQPRF